MLCISQELDYGALYEVRSPHFYVEANKMPSARVSETFLYSWATLLRLDLFNDYHLYYII